MRVLFTSRSSSGAWKIRGEQVAASQLGWHATNYPVLSEIRECDLVCVVKKAHKSVLDICRAYKKPVVLDVVDFWPQPKHPESYVSRRDSEELVKRLISKVRPDALIFPNRAMWADFLPEFPSIPTTYIYHHYRSSYDDSHIPQSTDSPKVVAYEGGNYLGEWRKIIEDVCDQFELTFLVNPTSLHDADVLLSVRGAKFQTYLNSKYKSNVKAANAFGVVKPFLCHVNERSAHEVDPGTFLFFNDAASFAYQLEYVMRNAEFRELNYQRMASTRSLYSLKSIKSEFDLFFHQVLGWYGRSSASAR